MTDASNAINASPLLITAIDVLHVAIPLMGEGFRNVYAANTTQHSIVLRLRTAEGTVGLGNVDPLPGYSSESIGESLTALRSCLVPAVLRMDAGNINRILQAMDACIPAHLEAKAALEMACVDALCTALGIPVHRYLGGAVVDELRFNAWIGIVSPDQASVEAAAWLARGFTSAKIKLGGGIVADRDRVCAVREAVGGAMQLRVDANAGYSVDESIALGRLLEPYELQLLEQPVAADDLAGLARVRQAIGIPIMADEAITDEASLIRAIRADCADIVKVKVMKQGGLLKCCRMIDTAASAGLKVVLGHGFGLSINTVAELMVAASCENVLDGLESVGPLKMQDDVVRERLDLSAGVMRVPHNPGLGLCIDEEKLEAYRVIAEQ